MQALPAALAPLGAWEQFVTWYALPHPTKPGKFDKVPCDWRTGHECSAHNPANWTTAAAALSMAPTYDKGYGSGAGFVFTHGDPFFFLDIDGALEADGQWSALAHELCSRFAGAAVEVSHSGRGLHIFGRTAPLAHSVKNVAHHLELYTSGRFVALTGTHAAGDAAQDCTSAVWASVAQYFPPAIVPDGTPREWTTEPVAEWAGPDDDDALIQKALAVAARSPAGAFGGKVTFADLWTGNADKLGAQWPPDGPGQAFDASHADQTLANHLAWWTGKDCERIERLMRASALVREKWDSPAHRGYLTTTILKACAFVTTVASLGSATPPLVAPDPVALQAAADAGGVTLRSVTGEYMGPHEQIAHFAGCTFISDQKLIYSLPRNKLFERVAFDVEYGGYLFVMDPMGQKTTDSAWTALTLSRVNMPPIVDDVCFRPELAPGEIVREGHGNHVYLLLNTYVPYECETREGDPGPFLAHLAKMFPVASDVAILVEYMARITQRPGVKVPWWPVIQGVQGNGKTLISLVLSYIFGEKYSHLPNAAALAKDGMKFNSWLYRKTYVAIEEVSLSHKRDFLEEFKPVVTNERIPLEGKGTNQVTGDNRANGAIFTNHKNGVPIDDNERRYALFFAAQQRKKDLERDGMTETYFEHYREWLLREGCAIVARYLKTFPLAASLPSRAPETSSTRAAVLASLGRAEQEIMEAIEEGRPGFCNGWVSSKYLDALLDGIKTPVPRNQRRAMMETLGYDWHPALVPLEGRVPVVITPDNGKPKLYVKYAHLALNITDPAQVADAYSKAQATGLAKVA